MAPAPPAVQTALRRTIEGLAAVGVAFGPIPVLAWLDDPDEQAGPQPGPAVRLSRAERRQWVRLVRRLR
jgi:hypothetical protein